MKNIYFAIVLLFSLATNAQVNVVITAPSASLSNGTTGLRAPNGNSSQTSLRACYFVPANELSALTASVVSFGFVLTNTLVSAPANGTLTVYLQNTGATSYTSGTSWSTATVGMTQVFSGVYNIPSGATATVVDFQFPLTFTFTGGALNLAYEYVGGQFAPNAAVYSAYTNSAVNCGATNASPTLPAVNTLSITTFRPLFRFGNPNLLTNDVRVLQLNAPGKVSQTTGTSHSITANIFNGSNISINNISVDLNIIGSNSFTANLVIPTLAAGAVTTVAFPVYNPSVLGISNINVTLPSDQNNTNNTVSFTQSLTCNVIGTAPASIAPTSYSSGVGFNTGSGVIYSRFQTATGQTLTGVDIGISSGISNAGNSVFAVAANNAGVVLATSNTLAITGNELNTFYTFTFNPTVFNANTNYYIGLAQTVGSSGYFPLGATPATSTPTLYVTQALAGGALSPLNSNLGFFAIEPFFLSPCGGVGIQEVNNELGMNIAVYPNPASSKVFISVSNVSATMKLQLTNMFGETIFVKKNISESNEIDLSNFKSGIYFVSIINGNERRTKKLVVE